MITQVLNFREGQIVKFVYNGKERVVEVDRIAESKDKKVYFNGAEHTAEMQIKSFRIDRLESAISVIG